MSADRWSVCPRCVQFAEREREAAFQKAKQAYGKVDAETYLQMIRDAERIDPSRQRMPSDLREDFSQGLKDGTYISEYHCHCQKCGWDWSNKTVIKTNYDKETNNTDI